MVDKKVQEMYNKRKESDSHEKMVSKINGGSHGSSMFIRRGSNWVSRLSATTATDSRSRGQNLYWGIRWVAVGI